METLPRLLLRLLVVPLGYFVGVLAGTLVILFGSWKIGQIDSFDVDAQAIALYGYAFAAPVLLVVLLSIMWLPTAIGILLSEAFALRSWMFHASNGALSAWIAWSLFGSLNPSRIPLNHPLAVIAAGVAGGLAYWAVAGWDAGVWKTGVRAERSKLPRPAATPPQKP
jgi:hypothetical protein